MNNQQQNQQDIVRDSQVKQQAVPSFLSMNKKENEGQAQVQQQQILQQTTSVVQINTCQKRDIRQAEENCKIEDDKEEDLLKELIPILSNFKHNRIDPSKKEEHFKFLEDFTQITKFQSSAVCCKNPIYIQVWIDYANSVQDSKAVYQYMIDHNIGKDDFQLYINLALHFEKFERNFLSATEIYKIGLTCTKDSPRDYQTILKHFQNFSERMKKRTSRDLLVHFPSEQAFKQMLQEHSSLLQDLPNKKRKYMEAFPEADLSSESQNSSKKRKLQEDVERCEAQVREYQNGIEVLKQQKNSNFQEISIHPDVTNELLAKPLSWISKLGLISYTSSSRFLLFGENIINESHTEIEESFKDCNNQSVESNHDNNGDGGEENKANEQQVCNWSSLKEQRQQAKEQKLESIGEVSYEIGSSLANLSHQANNSQNFLGLRSNIKLNDSNAFQTSKDSFESSQFLFNKQLTNKQNTEIKNQNQGNRGSSNQLQILNGQNLLQQFSQAEVQRQNFVSQNQVSKAPIQSQPSSQQNHSLSFLLNASNEKPQAKSSLNPGQNQRSSNLNSNQEKAFVDVFQNFFQQLGLLQNQQTMDMSKQLFAQFQEKMSISNNIQRPEQNARQSNIIEEYTQKQEGPVSNQQFLNTQPLYHNLPQQTQAIFQSSEVKQPQFIVQLNQENLRKSQQNVKQEQAQQIQNSQKRFSGILMSLIEGDEANSVHDIFPSFGKDDSPFIKHQQNQQTVQNSAPSNFIMNTLFGQQQQANQRQSAVTNNQKDAQNISMNNSFFDATPDHGTKFGNIFGSRAINKDYSVNQFNKKKTLSKGKELNSGAPNSNGGYFMMFTENDENNNSGIINSPFGPVSPMPYQQSRSRGSNVMRDSCCEGTDNLGQMIFKHQQSNYYPQNSGMLSVQQNNGYNQYQNLYSNCASSTGGQRQNYSNMTNNQQSHQFRDSVDSLGQEFQDCVDNSNNQQQQQKQMPPSALKPTTNNNSANHTFLQQSASGAENAQSRNTSKSVKFRD